MFLDPWSAPSRRVFSGVLRPAFLPIVLVGLTWQGPRAATGDPAEGAQLFRACAACHSLQPGRHRTGPSLAGIIGRKAGGAEGFSRFSAALRDSGVVWDETSLDPWLRDPAAFIPGNRMVFPGLPDDQARADLIAYLEQVSRQGVAEGQIERGGMMGGGELPDLKTLGPEHRVTGIRHCRDTYEVSTADGVREPFWEFNLRFKTDGSGVGPEPGKPVIVGAGMMGDRASVVFASPKEISAFIHDECPR
jgi:cytochrome c